MSRGRGDCEVYDSPWEPVGGAGKTDSTPLEVGKLDGAG